MKECLVCKNQFDEGFHGFEIMFKNQALMITFDEQELCEHCATELSDLFDNASMDTNVALVQNIECRCPNHGLGKKK